MKDFLTFKLSNQPSMRPVFELDNGLVCIFDTGSYMSVVRKADVEKFGANSMESSAILQGFGGSGKLTPIHYWKTFTLQQGNTKLVFHDFLAYVRDTQVYACCLAPFFLRARPYGIEPNANLKLACKPEIYCGYRRGRLPKVTEVGKLLNLFQEIDIEDGQELIGKDDGK